MGCEEHPLENHLVLSVVAGFLNFKDLRNFRLVSKGWSAASRARFQRKSCVVFKADGGRTRIRQFLKDDLLIFTTFKFIGLDMRRGGKYGEILSLFLRQCGSLVTEVAIVNCEADLGDLINELRNLTVLSIALPSGGVDGGGDDEEHYYQTELEVNPRVKCLEITGTVGGGDGSRNVDWDYFITAFPKTEIFGAHCRTSEDLTRLLSFLSAAPTSLPYLRDFSCVLTDFHNSHLEMLSRVPCQLTNLDVSIADGSDEEFIELLVQTHGALRNLKLFRDAEEPLRLFKFSKCIISSVLSTLDIQCNMIESLDFLQFFPALTTLSLTQFGDVEEVSFHNGLVRRTDEKLTLPSIRNLSYEYYLAPEWLEKLVVSLFPSLLRLSMYLTDEGIRILFQHAANLRELMVFGTQLSDEGITGVPRHLLERNYRFMKDYRKLPYIADLKYLWRFSLYPQPQEKLTDYSVQYGFLDSRSLTCIEIPETAISNDGIEKLQSKDNLRSLTAPFFCSGGRVLGRPSNLRIFPC